MVGVCGERGHQLRCVFCELEARIDVLLLILLLWQPTSALPAQLMLVCCCEQLSACTPVLPPPHTTAHSTPNTQQVREQTTGNNVQRWEPVGRTLSMRWEYAMAALLRLLLRCCVELYTEHSTPRVSTPRTSSSAVHALIHSLFLCVRCFLDACGCSEVFGRRRSVAAPVPLFPREVLARVIPTLKQSAH